jgi:Rod binding domain-containing protein
MDATGAYLQTLAADAEAARGAAAADRARGLAERAAGGGMTPEAARAAAEEFEAQVISQMMSAMFEGLETAPPFGGGHGEKMFRGMMIEEYAKSVTAGGGLGLADAVHAELLRAQEEAAIR